MPDPIERSASTLDMSRRFLETHAVVGSPALAAETTVASLTIPDDLVITEGIFLEAWCAFTVGTSGTGANLKIHHTNAAGATIAATGLVTVTAANLMTLSAQGIDAVAVLPGQIYIVTLTVAAGAAVSTVSAVSLFATIV
jgi:hypothetical protein